MSSSSLRLLKTSRRLFNGFPVWSSRIWESIELQSAPSCLEKQASIWRLKQPGHKQERFSFWNLLACRSVSTASNYNDAPDQTPSLKSDKGEETALPNVLYRGKGIQIVRLLVRLKVFQLAGIAALAVPINTFLAEGSVSGVQLLMAGGLLLGCGVASTTMWYGSRRYVGELSLVGLKDGRLFCRFSVLDFWGNREDNVVAVEDVIPPLKDMSPLALAELAEQPLIPLDVIGHRQYYISLRHGHLVNKEILFDFLNGRLKVS